MDRTIQTEGRKWLHYTLQAELLCVGENMRGSVYRSCLETIPSTTLAGAFKARFPHQNRYVYSACKLKQYQKETLIYAPRERHSGFSKIPLQIDYLANVKGDVYIQKNDWTKEFPDSLDLHVGAMKQQGFGRCHLQFQEELVANNPQKGKLAVRLLDNESYKHAFNIKRIHSPRYGYLFVPDHGRRGHYERGFFEGSQLVADPVVLATDSVTQTEADDPIADIIRSMIVQLRNLYPPNRSFCHNVAQVFEAHGPEITRLYLLDKSSQRDTQQASSTLLSALDILEKHEVIQQNPSIGRYIIKSLPLILNRPEIL